MKLNTIIQGDCLEKLKELENESVDLIVTDPPYGYSFMGKDWDKAVVGVDIWKECLRVLKSGGLAFIMSAPRQDVLSRMIVNLEDAGFNVGFTSLYHAFASGFPKASNIGKMVDKRMGVKKHEAKGFSKAGDYGGRNLKDKPIPFKDYIKPKTISDQAKALDGSYGGFQPKPAVEVILVAMKPLSEKTYVEQALKNRKGISWLDDCRIPYESEADFEASTFGSRTKDPMPGGAEKEKWEEKIPGNPQGRFPANLLVSDNVLNDKISYKSQSGETKSMDEDFDSRYFSLDKWWVKTFPFLIVPKASKSEKNNGLEFNPIDNSDKYQGKFPCSKADKDNSNKHPTVKPVKLMTYLITLGSRQGDVVLDPFMGSGTTGIAAKLLKRDFIGIEKEQEYIEIAKVRIKATQEPLL